MDDPLVGREESYVWKTAYILREFSNDLYSLKLIADCLFEVIKISKSNF